MTLIIFSSLQRYINKLHVNRNKKLIHKLNSITALWKSINMNYLVYNYIDALNNLHFSNHIEEIGLKFEDFVRLVKVDKSDLLENKPKTLAEKIKEERERVEKLYG